MDKVVNNNNTTNTTNGLTGVGLVWAVLVAAKLFEVPALAGWSWLAVITFPVWFIIGIILVFVLLWLLFIGAFILFGMIKVMFSRGRSG